MWLDSIWLRRDQIFVVRLDSAPRPREWSLSKSPLTDILRNRGTKISQQLKLSWLGRTCLDQRSPAWSENFVNNAHSLSLSSTPIGDVLIWKHLSSFGVSGFLLFYFRKNRVLDLYVGTVETTDRGFERCSVLGDLRAIHSRTYEWSLFVSLWLVKLTFEWNYYIFQKHFSPFLPVDRRPGPIRSDPAGWRHYYSRVKPGRKPLLFNLWLFKPLTRYGLYLMSVYLIEDTQDLSRPPKICLFDVQSVRHLGLCAWAPCLRVWAHCKL